MGSATVEVAGGRWAVTRAALRSPQLRRLLLAYLLFNIVEWAAWIAILVWAFDVGGVVLSTVVAVAQLVPAALLAPVVAAWSGRRRQQVALVCGYAAQGTTFAGTGAALLLDAPVPVVVGLGILSAIAVTMTRPVHNAVIPRISHTTGELTVGNAASGSVEGIAVLLGPMACAALIGPIGPGGVVLTMGLACLAAAALSLGLRLHTVAGRSSTDRVPPARATRSIIRNRSARTLTSLVTAEYVLVGTMDILLLIMAIDLLSMDQSGPALLNAALGVGGLVGAAAMVAFSMGARVAVAMLVGAGVAGAAFAVTSVAGAPWLAGVLLMASGAGKAVFDVSLRTLVQRALPEHLLTAVFGILEAVTMAGLAAGSLLVPFLVEAAGTQGAIVFAGLLLPIAALVTARRVRRLDRSVSVPADVAEIFSNVPILSVLAPRIIDRLAMEATPESLPAGTVVVSQGHAAQTFYVIRSGSVAVWVDDQHVRNLGPGGWFGELALLHDTPRTATVKAATDLELLVLDRATFLAFVAQVPRAKEAADEHARRTYR